jgi:hypothetical protein
LGFCAKKLIAEMVCWSNGKDMIENSKFGPEALQRGGGSFSQSTIQPIDQSTEFTPEPRPNHFEATIERKTWAR